MLTKVSTPTMYCLNQHEENIFVTPHAPITQSTNGQILAKLGDKTSKKLSIWGTITKKPHYKLSPMGYVSILREFLPSELTKHARFYLVAE